MSLGHSDNLPEEKVTIDGDTKKVVSYKVQDGKVKKVCCALSKVFVRVEVLCDSVVMYSDYKRVPD